MTRMRRPRRSSHNSPDGEAVCGARIVGTHNCHRAIPF